MDLSRQIEVYMQRSVKFHSDDPNIPAEVVLRAGNDYIPYIDQWNISDKPKPTMDQLNQLNDIVLPEEVAGKTNSDAINLLNSTDWLVTRHRDQLDTLRLGITTEQPHLTDEEYKNLLIARQKARDSVTKSSGE